MSNIELEYLLLNFLFKKPQVTQRELAKTLGVSLGKTHYLIRSLVDVGFLKLRNFEKSKNKWGYSYLITPRGIAWKASLTVQFLERKEREYAILKDEIDVLRKEVAKQKMDN